MIGSPKIILEARAKSTDETHHLPYQFAWVEDHFATTQATRFNQ
jgi:hypothetical protein